MKNFLSALGLLTTLPIPVFENTTLGKSLAYFPAVGAILGALLALAYFLFGAIFPPLAASALVLTLWAILTGALHLDAVADSGDGLLSSVSRERRLEIMRDPRVGSFGVVALVLVLIIKSAAIQSIFSVFLAPVLGRWAMTLAAAFPLARADGMAARFREGFGRREIFISTLFAAVAVGAFGWRGVMAWIAAALVALLVAWIAWNRLGGLTGDIYGSICEIVEVTVLLAANF
jgi:adenosylcobinamide-GDP ribazoletransferase